ncbi:hypothetical protein [Paenibacillus roseipurpureus]|uniref:Uncharacterized protein n=1 Tax=Paenibacillus roseopurpureus TaxID=2918901 RepID=A0AA96LK20_9BACL|nr:hypothetical protein [Paenibacillus sp. MBLB1832]WNR42329.1 hypothetical protein MJB10_14405 [Paenibacillus sp. MBLB1832]
MTIRTPQGLLIKLDVATSFGLMARLYPEISPKQILKTTEDISLMSTSMGFATGMLCFFLQLSPQGISVCTFTAMLIGMIFSASGLILFPFIQLGAAYGRIAIGFIPTILSIVVGYLLTGLEGVVAYFLTKCLAVCISMLVGIGISRQSLIAGGNAYSSSERNFFHAYRYYAEQIGQSMSLELTYEERNEAFWRGTYHVYVEEDDAYLDMQEVE